MQLTQGSTAPDFTLPDGEGKFHTLSQYRGGWVLLYFYPKDDTPGCTTEACTIEEKLPEFGSMGVTVLGVSVDPVASHLQFAKKYNLTFTLLSDTEKKVVNLYGVWGKKSFMGKEYEGTFRTSFLIDPDGAIAKVYEHVKPADHAGEVLSDMKVVR